MKVTVVGAGTMGNGIAQVFAMGNHEVILNDVYPEALEKAKKTILSSLTRMNGKGLLKDPEDAILSRIKFTGDLSEGKGSDLFIEAVLEKTDLKKQVLKSINTLANENSIIASNTSSISINLLSREVNDPRRFLGIHFFNPPPVMKLIEIVKCSNTSERVVKMTYEMAKSLSKEPVIVEDFPGFVSNRVLMPLIREAILVFEENVASKGDIDKTMKMGMNHPMGPLELADFIGLDVVYDIMQVLFTEFGDVRFKPPVTLRNLVNAGKLGRKTGEGFYKY
ncbi:3-hydroxyacyl-CoA dehydrogenase family protein [Oxyplasma meridianum]|uniref:3-hydroxyacyl-CoA dehydrogenase family protein n=1 Tax=Oxyplasma meridianum TaxID=3073602 RepID=A0AAX4NEN5_9ARCH